MQISPAQSHCQVTLRACMHFVSVCTWLQRYIIHGITQRAAPPFRFPSLSGVILGPLALLI